MTVAWLALSAAGLLSAQPISTSTVRELTLGEAYRAALIRSEVVAASSEAVQAALARVDELRSDVLPHLAFTGTETLQQNPHTGIALIDRSSIPQFSFQVTQPIFSGFREFLAYDQSKSSAAAAGFEERRAEEGLYQDVSQAFFTLAELQSETEIRKAIIGATEQQIAQLERWLRIGRSRRSELLATQAQLALDKANVEIASGQERVAQEMLRFLTGLDEELRPQVEDSASPDGLEDYLGRAANRSDVEAARKQYEMARLGTKIAERQRWPLVFFTGNYNVIRTGFNQNIDYNGIFTASLPIWDWGTIRDQVREGRAAEGAAEQAVSLAVRSAVEQVRAAFASLQAAIRAVGALEKAETADQASLDAQIEDYRHGLVTNLEVLTSLSTLESTRLTLSQQKQQAYFTRAQLEVAAGSPRTLR